MPVVATAEMVVVSVKYLQFRVALTIDKRIQSLRFLDETVVFVHLICAFHPSSLV